MAAEDKTSSETQTYSVRTTKEISDRIQELVMRTGLSSKDLFISMVENLESKLILETSPEQNQAMQQIRYHLSRVDSVFLGMAQKVVDVTADFTQRFDTQTLRHQEILDRLSQEKFELIKEATLLKEAADNISETLARNDEQLSELTERAKADKLTISVLSQKVESLEFDVQSVPSLIKQIEVYKEQIETMKQALREESTSKATLKHELEVSNRENVRLAEESNKQAIVLNQEHEQKIKRLVEGHEATVREQTRENARTVEESKKQQNLLNREHEKEIKQINEVFELKLQHSMLQIESEVSKAKQIGKEEQIVLMREHNQLIKDHAILREKYATLIPKKT